jgi:long-chain acyl-CoA synthetase
MPTDRPWLSHYDPGVPTHIGYPATTLHRFLEETAQREPDRACTVLRGSVVSYGEMDEVSDRIAAGLVGLGVQKGDRVGIFMPNAPQFVMAFYGILKAGAVVVATNPLYTPGEIIHQVNDAGIRVMLVLDSLYQTVKAAQPRTPMTQLIVASLQDHQPGREDQPGKGQGLFPGSSTAGAKLDDHDVLLQDIINQHSPGKRPHVDTGPDDVALLQYSGGTTGTSKGAVASHRGVVANTIQFQAWLLTLRQSSEVFLMAIPLYHAYGMIAGMSLAIRLGASLALVANPRDMTELLGTINQLHPTVFPGVPSLYNAGSTALRRETKAQFEQLSGGKICEGYGLSEAPVVTHCNPLLGVNKIGSIGMPMPDVDCLIVDPENPDLESGPGESGELILRGPQVMIGYHNLPAESDIALRRRKDGRTWLFTGDIVRMDSDGYFYIVDRKKELIKPGGFQVWPREVEEAIASHPAVLEVAVAGIPDLERSEAVKAWIVLKPGEVSNPEELREWCRDRLAPYKVPSFYEFRRELPKSTVGKVLRRELVREHIQGGSRAA